LQTIDRTVEIIETVGASPVGLTLTELCTSVELPKTTAFRILQALVGHDVLRKDESTKVYRLGPALITLGTHAVQQWDLRSVSRPYLQQLADTTNETVFLSVLYKDAAICLDTLDSDRSTRFLVGVGRRMEFHASAAAKAILAYQPDEEIARILQTGLLTPFTPQTITSSTELMVHLKQVRQRGYAFCDGEMEVGVRAIAAPIMRGGHQAIGSVGIVAPAERLDEEVRERVVPLLRESVRQISEDMGYVTSE
jgi:IclR family KDG regulon transcriptional repressor